MKKILYSLLCSLFATSILVANNVQIDDANAAESEGMVNVEVFVSDEQNCIVIGAGQYNIGDNVVLTAIPAEGYEFLYWYENNPLGGKRIYDNPYSFIIEDNCSFEVGYRKIPSMINGVSYVFAYDEDEDMNYAIVAKNSEYTGDIVIPESVTYNDIEYKVISIEQQAFAGTTISSLTIESDETGVDWTIIEGCTDLKSLSAPANIISELSESLWYLGSTLREIHFTGGYYWDDYIYLGNNHVEVLDLSGLDNEEIVDYFFKEIEDCNWFNLKRLILPEGLKKIHDRQFADLWFLEEIVIPEAITEIPMGAFYNCHALKNVTFNSNLTIIGDYAFYNAHNLDILVIPEGVTEIGEAAFYGCTSLDDLVLPSTATKIGNNAFARCTKLAKIKSKAQTPPMLCSKTFYEVDRNIPVYVAQVAYNDYVADQYWNEFFNIMPIAEFDGEATNVDNFEESEVVIYSQNGVVYLEGIDEEYSIFDASGRLIYSGYDTQISLSKGIYIIKTTTEAYKIIF